MKESIDLLGKILTNILTALYESFGFSLLLFFLAMFFYLFAYEPIHAGKGWKNAIANIGVRPHKEKINISGRYSGVRPHKEKINISEEFINKGSGSSLRCC